MKAATLYEREGMLFVHSSSITTAGVWIISSPVLAVGRNNPDEVGQAIKECLAASNETVPHPKSFANLFDPVLDLAGVKSFRAFMKSAKCVEIEMEADTAVTLVPTRNEGAKEGFSPLPNAVETDLSSCEALGSAAIEALARSE